MAYQEEKYCEMNTRKRSLNLISYKLVSEMFFFSVDPEYLDSVAFLKDFIIIFIIQFWFIVRLLSQLSKPILHIRPFRY